MLTPEEIRAAKLDDFRVFLALVWEHLRLPKPTRVQNDIAKWLQHGPRRMIIEAFRGVGKSYITVAFVVWNLLLDPQKKILVVSASQPLADNFSVFTKQLIFGMELLQSLIPRQEQRRSNVMFDVGPARDSKDPSVKSAGLTGQITGNRADIIVADDIEIPKNSYTAHLREKLREQVKEFDAILKPGGRVVYLGTPQIEDSLYNQLRKKGYTVRIWPAEIPKESGVYQGALAPIIERMIENGVSVGTPTDPDRFDRRDLDERLLSFQPAGYALQFMLDTSPADADKHPLRCRDILVDSCDLEMAPSRITWSASPERVVNDLGCAGFDGDRWHRPDWKDETRIPYQDAVMYIDPSGQGSDETAYAIVKIANSVLYVLSVGGFKDGYGPRTLESLAKLAGEYGVRSVLPERNYGGGMFDQLLTPYLQKYGNGARILTEDDGWKGWSKGQKEVRILDTLEPLFRTHKIVLDRRVVEADLLVSDFSLEKSMVYQMTRITRERGALIHDDRVEALAGACGWFAEKLKYDQEKQHEAQLDEAFEQDLLKWLSDVEGGDYSAAVYADRRRR